MQCLVLFKPEKFLNTRNVGLVKMRWTVGTLTRFVTVYSRGSRWSSGSLSLLPPTVHTPAVTCGPVALLRPVLTLIITLRDEASHQSNTTVSTLKTVSVLLTLGLGTTWTHRYTSDCFSAI